MSEDLLKLFNTLTENQQRVVLDAARIFANPMEKSLLNSSFLSLSGCEFFGDYLQMHHSFSNEPFTKDKFEFLLVKTLKHQGKLAELALKGLRGHDIMCDGERISLKTQADKTIKSEKLWISKFMELGKQRWEQDLTDLEGLRDAFLSHLNGYDRIFSLRALKKAPNWHYELVEIPKTLLEKVKSGRLEMRFESIQLPKPGYCFVEENGSLLFQLYFDAGGERKLQIQHLQKSRCILHASWSFKMPREEKPRI